VKEPGGGAVQVGDVTTLSATGDGREIATTVLDRARRGDQEAFAAVIRHYDSGLRALAYRLLGDRDRMDDALQEAYVKAFRALPRFRGESRLGTWLYRIAYNACMDELERSRRVVQLPLDGVMERPQAGAGPGEVAALRGDLAQALAALPVEERAAVLLVDAQGFDYRSAGHVLGVAEGTVASRLSRARAALRAALGEAAEGLREG
jgi:RNA polymerase sigma-70 factor, ECF subfamily